MKQILKNEIILFWGNKMLVMLTVTVCIFTGFLFVGRQLNIYITMVIVILGLLNSLLTMNNDLEVGTIQIPLLKGYSRTQYIQAKIIWCVLIHYMCYLLIAGELVLINSIKRYMGQTCLYKNSEIILYLLYIGLPTIVVSILCLLNLLITKNILMAIFITIGYVFLTLLLQQNFLQRNVTLKYLFVSFHLDYFVVLDEIPSSIKGLLLIVGQLLCILKIYLISCIMNRKMKQYHLEYID